MRELRETLILEKDQSSAMESKGKACSVIWLLLNINSACLITTSLGEGVQRYGNALTKKMSWLIERRGRSFH
jgi:hypothetical protein